MYLGCGKGLIILTMRQNHSRRQYNNIFLNRGHVRNESDIVVGVKLDSRSGGRSSANKSFHNDPICRVRNSLGEKSTDNFKAP